MPETIFKKKQKLLFVISIIVVSAITVGILLIGPQRVVDAIGVQNSYVAIFILGAIGVVSTITGTFFYATLTTFASAEINALALGVAAGLGLFVSDSIFYNIVSLGRGVIGSRMERWLEKLKQFVHKAPDPVVYVFSYLYFGFSPFPNDLLMIALIAGDYSYKKIAPLILLGNTTLTIIIAHLGTTIF